MVDKQEIQHLLNTYFQNGEAGNRVRFQIEDSGIVNVQEITPGYGVLLAQRGLFPNGKLPVKFGVCYASLILDRCGLTSLEGCPQTVGGRFTANKNPLKDMTGGPQEVSGRVGFKQEVPVLSLAGFPQRVGQHLSINYHDKLPLLRALNCQQGIMLYGPAGMFSKLQKIEAILFKYAGQGKRALFDCQKDLEDAGFEGNARW